MRTLADNKELVEASGNDPHVRGTLRHAFATGWEHEGAIAWIGLDNEDQLDYLSFIGPVGPAVELFDLIVPGIDLRKYWVAVERPIVRELRGVRFDQVHEWEVRWTFDPPPLDDLGELRWIDDPHAISTLLDEHAPRSSARPGDSHVHRWAAAFDGSELVAVAADTSAYDVGHISSVATDRRRRGEGWGARVTSWLARQQLAAGFDVVSLGMFAANETAIRLYSRLGFTHVRQMTSGPMAAL